MSERASRLVFFVGLLVIVGVGTFARWWQINESLWLDELHTSWVVSDTFDAIAPRARIGNQSPLYFYLIRCSTLLLGQNELALRLPSLLAGVGVIVVAGIVTWRWCGVASAGWLAATLVAIDRNMIFFSQEARAYALVQFVALLQLAAFWRLQTIYDRRHRLTVVVGWIVMFYLHYTTILLIAGELVWWAIIQGWQRGKGSYRPAHLICDVVVAGIACAISWSHLVDIASRRAMWEMFIPKMPPWVAFRWFHCDLYVFNAIALCAGVFAAAYVWRRWSGKNQAFVEAPAWIAVVPLIALWWTMPVMIAWYLTASDVARVFFPRYLIGVAVAPMIGAGLCVAACRPRAARVVVAATLVVLAIFGNGLLSQFLRDGRLLADRRQDWRGAVAWLNETRTDAKPVFVRSGLIEADRLRLESDGVLRRYCLLPVTGLYTIRQPGDLFPLPTSHTGHLSSQAIQSLKQRQGGWFVINARPETHDALRRELLGSIGDRRMVFQRGAMFGNVAVWEVGNAAEVER